MALSEIDQYKQWLKDYLETHFDEVVMNRGKMTTTFFIKHKSKVKKIQIDNTEIESCQKANTIPKEIKILCK